MWLSVGAIFIILNNDINVWIKFCNPSLLAEMYDMYVRCMEIARAVFFPIIRLASIIGIQKILLWWLYSDHGSRQWKPFHRHRYRDYVFFCEPNIFFSLSSFYETYLKILPRPVYFIAGKVLLNINKLWITWANRSWLYIIMYIHTYIHYVLCPFPGSGAIIFSRFFYGVVYKRLLFSRSLSSLSGNKLCRLIAVYREWW